MFSIRTLRKLREIRASKFRKFSQNQSKDIIFEYLSGENAGISVFGLNRPQQKNAFSANLVSEFNENLEKLRFEDKTRVLVIRSLVPGIFCAGADLKERLSMPQSEVGRFVSKLRSLLDKVHKLQVPVIAALDGLALGGGLELALACDIRIASNESKMGLVEGRLAIIPGAGGTQRLPKLINPSIAKELIYTSRIITGDEAWKLGLVNHALPQNAEGDVAFIKSLELAREILPNGPVAVKMAKSAIDRGLEVDINSGLAIEEYCYAQLIPTRDRIEGLEAFKAKRKPKYTGD